MPTLPTVPPAASATLADQLEDLLPQTQCTKCGYPACRPYAVAMAEDGAAHNQCPPGGAQGIARLSAVLGRPVIPLNPVNGVEKPRERAVIDEAICIGCTLCIQACPVDAIVGAAKQMHTIVPDLCTGCDLCVAPCPVDCIAMVPVPELGNRTGWDAWTQEQADDARLRHDRRAARLLRDRQDNDARMAVKAAAKMREVESNQGKTPDEITEQARKKAMIEAAMERARLKKEQAAADAARADINPKNTP